MNVRLPARSNQMMRNRSRRQIRGEPGRHCGNDKEQGDDCGRQCVRRHHVPDSKRRDQRHQQNGREQLLAPRPGRPIARWDNVVTVQEGHRILIRKLELW